MKPSFRTLLLALSLLAPSCSQGEAAATQSSTSPEADRGSRQVNSSSFSTADPRQRQNLVYLAGSNRINQLVVTQLIYAERDRRVKEGVDPTNFEVSDEQLGNRMTQQEATFVNSNPDFDFWEQVAAQGMDTKAYREESRNMLLIDRLLFPPDPDAWDLDALAEIFDKGGENSMYENMVEENIPKVKEAFKKGDPLPTNEMLAQMVLRPYFMKWLWDQAEIVYPFDGLPEGVALRVDGIDYTTDELVDSLGTLVGVIERQWANDFTHACRLAEDRLQKMGLLLTAEETHAIIAEEKVEYENSPISYEMIALQFLGYPTMELYNQVFRLKHSFKKSLGDPYAQEALDTHAEARKMFLTNGRVDCEVILYSAKNLSTGRFPLVGDPFGDVEKKATAAAKELADGADWNAILTRDSDYPAKKVGASSGGPVPNGGRFGALPLNQLREFVGENEFSDFTLGSRVAASIFFDAEPNVVYGPIRGPLGWYIYKLNRRIPSADSFVPKENERQAYLLTSDFLSEEFLAFINSILDES